LDIAERLIYTLSFGSGRDAAGLTYQIVRSPGETLAVSGERAKTASEETPGVVA
jgi:hypothetical protein